MKYAFAVCMFFLLAWACNPNQDVKVVDAEDEVLVKEDEKASAIRITDFPTSVKFDDAAIDRVVYDHGKFSFDISGEGYTLGVQTPDADSKMCANSEKGQHIHLIVDDEPYSAQYSAEFDYEIPDGQHYLLAFLSRSYHESIKTPQAAFVKKVMIKDNDMDEESALPITTPMLFYSRPKGTYVGKKATEKVMLDFYLVNATLGDDYKVKAELGDQTFMLNEWKPYYLEGLPLGDHTLTLTLVDSDGQRVDAPLNPVSRTFTLQADPAEQAVEQ